MKFCQCLVVILNNNEHLFQFSSWIDALLLVFSLENEESFSIVCSFYNRMCSFRNMSEVPKILVGVQGTYFAGTLSISLLFLLAIPYIYFPEYFINFVDSINDSNPRVIKDVRPRKLACDLRCPYYETCAIYGLNVERVFQDGKDVYEK